MLVAKKLTPFFFALCLLGTFSSTNALAQNRSCGRAPTHTHVGLNRDTSFKQRLSLAKLYLTNRAYRRAYHSYKLSKVSMCKIKTNSIGCKLMGMFGMTVFPAILVHGIATWNAPQMSFGITMSLFGGGGGHAIWKQGKETTRPFRNAKRRAGLNEMAQKGQPIPAALQKWHNDVKTTKIDLYIEDWMKK